MKRPESNGGVYGRWRSCGSILLIIFALLITWLVRYLEALYQ